LAVVQAERAAPVAQQAVCDSVIARIQALPGEEEIRRQELLWFVVSWILRRWPRADARRMIQAFQANQADAARRAEVQTMSETIEKTWEEEERERIAQAAAEGEARGEALGLLRSRQQDLRVILEERFGIISPGTLDALRAIQDPDRLLNLVRQALRVAALTDLDL
jgi:hypothetical protein